MSCCQCLYWHHSRALWERVKAVKTWSLRLYMCIGTIGRGLSFRISETVVWNAVTTFFTFLCTTFKYILGGMALHMAWSAQMIQRPGTTCDISMIFRLLKSMTLELGVFSDSHESCGCKSKSRLSTGRNMKGNDVWVLLGITLMSNRSHMIKYPKRSAHTHTLIMLIIMYVTWNMMKHDETWTP